MIPILYGSKTTSFSNNGICRLRDMIECQVSEERNSIYECDFSYPVDGANFEKITCGRIIGVTHDETGDVQPFDIVSMSRPISGVVTFHAVHVSYRQCGITARGKNINSLSSALTMLKTSASPSNPFTYETDFTSSNYMAAADGTPRSVRQLLGGLEGSILDSYGGEYEWDKFTVRLKRKRGQDRDFTIRYGVNLLDFTQDIDYFDTFTSCVPYWRGQNANGVDTVKIGTKAVSGQSSFTGRDICIPLDLSDKFETIPTSAQLKSAGESYMRTNQTHLPSQNISVDFIRLSEMSGYEMFNDLLKCSLCDTINVVFPLYGVEGRFKIVKTVWDVLRGRYTSMELGKLSTTLAEALGISESLDSNREKAQTFIDDTLRVTGDVYAGVNADGTGGHPLVGASLGIETYEATTVSTGTSFTSLGELNLDAGAYVIVAMADFGSSATGRRCLRWYNVTGGNAMTLSTVTLPAVSGTDTRIQSVFVTQFSSANKYRLECYQTSGGDLSVTGYVRYIKLK